MASSTSDSYEAPFLVLFLYYLCWIKEWDCCDNSSVLADKIISILLEKPATTVKHDGTGSELL